MEDDIKDLDDSIFRATISNSAKSKLPLILPWHPKQTILIGTLFHSSNLTDPWAKNSPFQTHLPDVVVQREDGTEASFRSQSTSSESSSHDHLSLGFGVSVGLPFLATVSVSGTYDKDVFENKDSNKSSIRTSVRAGTVTFTRQPKLTNEAIITIKYHGGLPAFQQRYGDYYVAGYRLGGDTQMMLSGSNSSKRELEKFGVTVKAEVLFVEASTTYTKDFEENGATSELSLIGYDTLDCDNWKCEKGSLALEMQTQAAKVIEKSQSLDVRISGKLNELGIEDGAYLSNETCRKLTEAGLVVELILLPVGTLRQVIDQQTLTSTHSTLLKTTLHLEHGLGLGHKPNVIPAGAAEISGPLRSVQIGWHPVGGWGGKWFAERTGLGKAITKEVKRFPDPSQHWAVLVGGFAHELWMDEHLDVIYINEEINQEDWHTFDVGQTRFNDEALRQAGEMVIHNMREKRPAYNIISNNCQNFAVNLLDAIQIGAHREFATSFAVYQAATGKGEIKDLFEDRHPEEQDVDQRPTVQHAQQVIEENTTKLDNHQSLFS